MVERGQVLERMTLVRSGELELEALFQAGGVRGQGMPVVLAPSHPRHGGMMDSAVLGELVWWLARRGHPTLRFNWRGVGASMGTSCVPWPPAQPVSLDDELADLRAAVEQHACGRACALIGVGFGALVVAELGRTHPLVDRVALVAPLVALRNVDVRGLLDAGVEVSVWAGDADTSAPLGAIRAHVEPHVTVNVVAGAGHSFSRGLSQLGRAVAAFMPAPLSHQEDHDA